ncbi:unnamed protein product [Pedinophyceae sp. YPF-701]|nr:unnamed protein product [Pedinophyceae sp. YPF-701]
MRSRLVSAAVLLATLLAAVNAAAQRTRVQALRGEWSALSSDVLRWEPEWRPSDAKRLRELLAQSAAPVAPGRGRTLLQDDNPATLIAIVEIASLTLLTTGYQEPGDEVFGDDLSDFLGGARAGSGFAELGVYCTPVRADDAGDMPQGWPKWDFLDVVFFPGVPTSLARDLWIWGDDLATDAVTCELWECDGIFGCSPASPFPPNADFGGDDQLGSTVLSRDPQTMLPTSPNPTNTTLKATFTFPNGTVTARATFEYKLVDPTVYSGPSGRPPLLSGPWAEDPIDLSPYLATSPPAASAATTAPASSPTPSPPPPSTTAAPPPTTAPSQTAFVPPTPTPTPTPTLPVTTSAPRTDAPPTTFAPTVVPATTPPPPWETVSTVATAPRVEAADGPTTPRNPGMLLPTAPATAAATAASESNGTDATAPVDMSPPTLTPIVIDFGEITFWDLYDPTPAPAPDGGPVNWDRLNDTSRHPPGSSGKRYFLLVMLAVVIGGPILITAGITAACCTVNARRRAVERRWARARVIGPLHDPDACCYGPDPMEGSRTTGRAGSSVTLAGGDAAGWGPPSR